MPRTEEELQGERKRDNDDLTLFVCSFGKKSIVLLYNDRYIVDFFVPSRSCLWDYNRE